MARPLSDLSMTVFSRLRQWTAWRGGTILPTLVAGAAPLDLRIVGRMLLHASAVGIAAGFAGAAFFGALEFLQRLLLEQLAGYSLLRAHGETFAAPDSVMTAFRPWLLVLLPALGGVGCGLLTRLAPETRGGGGDAMLEALHQRGGVMRRRVAWIKAAASLCTLGTGGAGGREGPTMQIGASLGALLARVLKVNARERRILLLSGVAAGISAVFRTPLGAALLAVEILYRDGFESEALVPCIFASVVAYSIVISVFGESTLFAHAPRFEFVPWHLGLYAILSVLLAALAACFVAALRSTKRVFAALPVPAWQRPAIGGLALGALSTVTILLVGSKVDTVGQGLGILGGGYGAIQTAITGASWLPSGWAAVHLLVFLSILKLFAACLTIGSEGSAGDFAPSLAIGGLFGGAFGRAVQLIVEDPRIDAGAFTLVGMGVFYGGIAHVPLSALVLVCELAGNYDLLVPLMLSQGIAFIALRNCALYEAQLPTQFHSPAHSTGWVYERLRSLSVGDVMTRMDNYITFGADTPIAEMRVVVGESPRQDVFPVVDQEQLLIGLVTTDALKLLVSDRNAQAWARAADLMQAPLFARPNDDLRAAAELLVANGLREIPVLDDHTIVGFLDEREVARVYLESESHSRDSKTTTPQGGRG